MYFFVSLFLLLRTHRGDEHESTMSCARQVAMVLHERGQHAEAARVNCSCLPFMRRVLGDEHTDTINAMHEQAGVLWDSGERQEAVRVALEHVGLMERVKGEEDEMVVSTMHGILQAMHQTKMFEAGERLGSGAGPCAAGCWARNTLDAMHLLAAFLYPNDKEERCPQHVDGVPEHARGGAWLGGHAHRVCQGVPGGLAARRDRADGYPFRGVLPRNAARPHGAVGGQVAAASRRVPGMKGASLSQRDTTNKKKKPMTSSSDR